MYLKKEFLDKSCSVPLSIKENVIKSQDYRFIWSQSKLPIKENVITLFETIQL